MTAIQQFSELAGAEIAAGMLKAHGIAAQVESNSLNTLFPGSEGGVYLLVPDEKAVEAQELLSQHKD